MPNVRKLSVEEIEDHKNGKLSRRQKTAFECDNMLKSFELGDWGEVILSDEDNRLTVRNRLQAAAERRHYTLYFHRTDPMMLRFEVKSAQIYNHSIEATNGLVLSEDNDFLEQKEVG